MEIGDFTQVRTTYDTLAADYAARFPSTEPEDALDLAMIEHFVALLPPSPTVLDAGCGTGRMSRYLADRGCRVVGLDLSPGMVSMARRDHPELSFSIGSIVDLPYADASVDAAMYWYSAIHSPDALLPGILAEAARVVRPAATSSSPSRSAAAPATSPTATARSGTMWSSLASTARPSR